MESDPPSGEQPGSGPPAHEPAPAAPLEAGDAPPEASQPRPVPVRLPARASLGPHHREDVPGLVLMWCLWLLGSWLIVRWQDGMTARQMLGLSDYAGPEVTAMDLRWMILAAAAGLSGLWPAVRLSQVPLRGRVLDALVQPMVDWLSLMIIWQAVLWPVYALVGWPLEQVIWLDIATAGWALLMAAVIGWGRSDRTPGRRVTAMAICVGLLLAEPALLGLGHGLSDWLTNTEGPLAWTPRISPLPMLWALAAPPGYFVADPWRWHALSLAGTGALAWGGLIAGARAGRRAARATPADGTTND